MAGSFHWYASHCFDRVDRRRNPVIQLLSLSFAFHDLKFCLSSQLTAASCARCSSEIPPSKQVNGHSFTICLIVWRSRSHSVDKSSCHCPCLPLSPGGSVSSLIETYGRFNDAVLTKYTLQILRGLAHLHENHILHRDLKGG